MGEWAAILREECEQAEKGLADAIGLGQGISAEEFESVVGGLLTLQGALPLIERFRKVGAPEVNTTTNHIEKFVGDLARRMEAFEGVLRKTLYAQFGVPAVDGYKATALIGALVDALEGEEGLQFATNRGSTP